MIDLHMHSVRSDGTMTPGELVDEAVRCGMSAIALTDHDTVGGVDELLEACQRSGAVRGVPGVEISVDGRYGSMHLLGYLVDHHHPALVKAIDCVRNERTQRNEAILANLNDRGMELTMERIQALASGDVVGRPHFAKAIVEDGRVRSMREAFDRYLGDRGTCYVSVFRFPVESAIEAIHEAGGVAVLAHPVVLRLGVNALDEFVGELAAMGLDGLEVFYPEHTGKHVREFRRLMDKYALVASGGSDFHGSRSPDIKMGAGFGALHVDDEILVGLESRVADRAGAAG